MYDVVIWDPQTEALGLIARNGLQQARLCASNQLKSLRSAPQPSQSLIAHWEAIEAALNLQH